MSKDWWTWEWGNLLPQVLCQDCFSILLCSDLDGRVRWCNLTIVSPVLLLMIYVVVGQKVVEGKQVESHHTSLNVTNIFSPPDINAIVQWAMMTTAPQRHCPCPICEGYRYVAGYTYSMQLTHPHSHSCPENDTAGISTMNPATAPQKTWWLANSKQPWWGKRSRQREVQGTRYVATASHLTHLTIHPIFIQKTTA